MDRRLSRALDAVESAAELTDDATVREQLDSVANGLDTLSGADAPADDAVEGDRLEELERQLVELGDEADDLTRKQLAAARDNIDAYRREEAPDWE